MLNQSTLLASRVRGALVIFALGAALSCAAGGPGTPSDPNPPDTSHASRVPSSNAAFEPTQSHVVNAFPIVRGVIPALVNRRQGTAVLPHDPLAPVSGGTTTMDALTTPTGTLVLYDDTGPWGWLGELYAIAAQSLASHFGTA